MAPYAAKRAETRECPICGEDIPLRLLGQHYTLENSRVQAILDHIGDLEGFSDPHALAHAPYVDNLFTTEHVGGYMLMQYLRSMPRRRAAPHLRDAPAAFASRLAKVLSSIKRRRKARYIALRDVMRDEDDLSVIGKGKGRATTTAGQCPVCLKDVDGDLDVISAHIDVCLAHAEMQWPASSIGTDADGDASLNIEGYGGEDGSDVWEESETPDGVRRLRLRAGARNGAIALGFAVGDRAVDDVDDEIDVEGDDLSAFGATNFTEVDILAEPCDSELSRGDTGRRAAEAEVDLTIERARQGKDSQALIVALERKVQLLMVRQHFPSYILYLVGFVSLIRALGCPDGRYSVRVSHLSRGI